VLGVVLPLNLFSHAWLSIVQCGAPAGVQEDCNVVSRVCIAGQVLLSVLDAATSNRLGLMSCTCGVGSVNQQWRMLDRHGW
jgi:hypothetical protein